MSCVYGSGLSCRARARRCFGTCAHVASRASTRQYASVGGPRRTWLDTRLRMALAAPGPRADAGRPEVLRNRCGARRHARTTRAYPKIAKTTPTAASWSGCRKLRKRRGAKKRSAKGDGNAGTPQPMSRPCHVPGGRARQLSSRQGCLRNGERAHQRMQCGATPPTASPTAPSQQLYTCQRLVPQRN